MDNVSQVFQSQLEDACKPPAYVYTGVPGPNESPKALQKLALTALSYHHTLSQGAPIHPTLGKPQIDVNMDLSHTFNSSQYIDGLSREPHEADILLHCPKPEFGDSEGTLSDISDSEFVEFDVEALDIGDKHSSKKRKRSSTNAKKSRKISKKDVSGTPTEYVRGREEIFIDRFGNPVSIFAIGHPFQQKKPASFATLNDLLHIGELMNNIYEWWKVSQFKSSGVTGGSINRLARRCVAPPDPSLLRVCKKLRREATTKYYSEEISKCEGMYFKDTKALYDFLTSSSKEEVHGLTAAWVNYEANIFEFDDHAGPYDDDDARANFKWLDCSRIYNHFYQIDLGPRYAFDAFELLRLKCPNLDTLVINRSLAGAALRVSYPGVWALRGLRRLKRFRFEGVIGQYEKLNRIIRNEVRRKKDRKQDEENTSEAVRLRTRDSERQRGMTGKPVFREGVPTLVQWVPT